MLKTEDEGEDEDTMVLQIFVSFLPEDFNSHLQSLESCRSKPSSKEMRVVFE
jgi:hypothetical protein